MTERELFLYELEGRGFSFKDKTYTEFGFNDEILNMVYEMWQSSALREGYKLVPVGTLQEALGWAKIAEWDSPNKETDEEIRKHKSVIEKAITGTYSANKE